MPGAACADCASWGAAPASCGEGRSALRDEQIAYDAPTDTMLRAPVTEASPRGFEFSSEVQTLMNARDISVVTAYAKDVARLQAEGDADFANAKFDRDVNGRQVCMRLRSSGPRLPLGRAARRGGRPRTPARVQAAFSGRHCLGFVAAEAHGPPVALLAAEVPPALQVLNKDLAASLKEGDIASSGGPTRFLAAHFAPPQLEDYHAALHTGTRSLVQSPLFRVFSRLCAPACAGDGNGLAAGVAPLDARGQCGLEHPMRALDWTALHADFINSGKHVMPGDRA